MKKAKGQTWIFVAVLFGILILALIISQIPRSFFNRDWSQDYISGKAVLADRNPWEMLDTLSEDILHLEAHRAYRNPHPPLAVLIAIPFCFSSYATGGILWLIIEVAALIASLTLIGRILGHPNPSLFGAATVLCLTVWPPLFTDLANGQYQCFVLLLLLLVWRSLRKQSDFAAGLWLGVAIALKLAGLLILPWAIYRRKWKLVIAAGLSWIACHLAAAAVIGWKWCLFYYTDVAATLNKPFLTGDRNFSIYAVGQRAFRDTSNFNGQAYTGSALINAPHLAGITSVLLMLAFITLILWRAGKLKSLDAQMAILIMASAICLPVTWDYYLLLALPALLIAILAIELPDNQSKSLALFIVAFSVAGNTLIEPFWRGLSVKGSVLISFWPLLGVILLTGFLIKAGSQPYVFSASRLNRMGLIHSLLTGMFVMLLAHAALPMAVAIVCLLAGCFYYEKGIESPLE